MGTRNEEGFYYTKEKGGLIKHTQPMELYKSKRECYKLILNSNEALGPGTYNPKLPQDKAERIKS
jgi:hypothetical protein